MKTIEMLERKFNGPTVQLANICQDYLGLSPKKAAARAGHNQLPLPAYRLGSQKSPWLVQLTDLAKLIDDKAELARMAQGGGK